MSSGEQEEREARLLELEADEASLIGDGGAPMGGARNGGAYVFSVLLAATEPERLPAGLSRRVLYLDAEDGTRSNWCRFINHAHYDAPSCNLEPRSDPLRCLVWFEARREIAKGEELLFSYGAAYNATYGKSAHEARATAGMRVASGAPEGALNQNVQCRSIYILLFSLIGSCIVL